MLSFDLKKHSVKLASLLLVVFLAGCQFQPLHGERSLSTQASSGLGTVGVSQVNSRVAQQVRNHLLFLFNGGFATPEKTHEARIRVSWNDRQISSVQGVRDSTAGIVTVIVNYDLIDLSTGKPIARGKRQAVAAYDRTGQVFSNNRAVRDAENRAAKEAAENTRLAIAADMSKI